MTRTSTESKTSHAIAANLSEFELKKILIDKMESNKSIQRSDEQKNLYKASVEAYESDKLLLDTYGDTVSFKRRRDDADKDEEPSAGSNRGTTEKSAQAEEPVHTNDDLKQLAHLDFNTGFTEEQPTKDTTQFPDCTMAQKQDQHKSFNELMYTPLDFSAFVMNQLNVKMLTPELLAGPTFELMKGTCKSLTELEYFCEEVYKATTEQLDWINHEGQQYPHDLRKPLPLGISHWGKKQQQFYAFAATRESARDVYSKHRIIAVTKLEIVEWHNYKHLDWIIVHRDDDKLYKFKEGDFNRLRIQDIEDMLLTLAQGKLINLT
ncbi:hypothetical protein Tco_1538768, partial [Tanacetum coccineum]